jgi:DNA-binding MarR family transcriptional regulator
MPSKAQPSASAAADETSARGRRKSSPGVSAPLRADRANRQEDLLGDSLAYAIKRTQVRCDEALARYLDPGLSPARFAALSTVGANPGISQAALSGLLNIAGPSVVKVVDDLERMGLMRRETSSDRRVYALKLTDKGTDDLKRYQGSIRTYEKKIAALLTPQERTQLFALLAKVAANEP